MDNLPLIVAAIDFGTTYSGYAFLLRHDYQKDLLKFMGNHWKAGESDLVSHKTPSTILLTPDKEFHSFGYEAENKYTDLTENDDHHGWLYFTRFKMVLHNNKELKRTTMVKDVNGEAMPAMTIFSMAIQYLKKTLTDKITSHVDTFFEDMIHWVLTVPAIWDYGAKQFMREAAKKAGIKHERLKLALEPEAASILCMKVPTVNCGEMNSGFKEFDAGTKYMVLDLGGGTVDITVHEVISDGQVREIHRASGGGLGGTTVDDAFYQFLVKLFGSDVLNELKCYHLSDYLYILRHFEMKKRTFKPESDNKGKVTMRLPLMLLEIFRNIVGQSFSESLSSSSFSETVHIRGDKMQINADIFRQFFQEAVDGIVEHATQILAETEIDIKIILLVGGFSESQVVQEKFRNVFSDKTIISPPEAELAVLKGAVLFGYRPRTIKSRISQYTYGVNTNRPFIPGKHPEIYRRLIKNESFCTNIFDHFVMKDTEIECGSVISQTYTPKEIDAASGIGVYASTRAPDYTTHPSVEKLGAIVVKYPNGGWPPDSKIKVDMEFGGTEFTVSITDDWLGQTYTDSYDFLQQ